MSSTLRVTAPLAHICRLGMPAPFSLEIPLFPRETFVFWHLQGDSRETHLAVFLSRQVLAFVRELLFQNEETSQEWKVTPVLALINQGIVLQYPVKAGSAGAVTESLWSDQSGLHSEYNQEQQDIWPEIELEIRHGSLFQPGTKLQHATEGEWGSSNSHLLTAKIYYPSERHKQDLRLLHLKHRSW